MGLLYVIMLKCFISPIERYLKKMLKNSLVWLWWESVIRNFINNQGSRYSKLFIWVNIEINRFLILLRIEDCQHTAL